MSRYPVYILSKGRYKNPMTVTYFKKDNVDFKIVVEPQEYEEYCNSCGKENVLMLPFSNLGLGGTPARNWIFEHSISLGYKRHWIFDDNIRYCRVLEKGKRIPINYNKGIEIIENLFQTPTSHLSI